MKKLSKTAKVLRYVKSNPNAKAKEVAQAVGVPVNTVYQVVHLTKKKVNGVPMTALTPKVNSVPPKREKLRMVSTTDNVNHPAHYKAGGIETIDFIEAKHLNYNLGNVVKYITRADLKGNRLEDLQKAQWYLNREIANVRKAK